MIKKVFKYIGIVVMLIVAILVGNIWKNFNKQNQSDAFLKEVTELKVLEANKILPTTIDGIYIYPAESEGTQLIYRYKLLDVEKGNHDEQVLRSAMIEEFCHDENDLFFKVGGSVLFYVEDKNSTLLAKKIISGKACENYLSNNAAINEAEQNILRAEQDLL